jgi:hypothetical protein
MPLTLRRIAPENDYDVFDKGKVVGRVYRIHNSELWRWTARLQEPTGGVANTLQEAKAAFRRTWDQWGQFAIAHGRSPRSNEELQQWAASPEGTRALAARN